MNQETKEFIRQHLSDNVAQLALKGSSNPNVDMQLAIRQINGVQKLKNKVPGFSENLSILYPRQLSLEQCSSETTANYKASLCEGNSLVDLTGGFGIDFYYMVQHFAKADYVEQQQELCELANHNFATLKLKNFRVHNQKAEDFLDDMTFTDQLFIDPARRDSGGNKLVRIQDCEPDIAKLWPVMLEKSNQIMVKLSPMIDISSTLNDLCQLSEIHIISVENECKEVLLLKNDRSTNAPEIHTINFGKNDSQQLFSFSMEEEHLAVAQFAKTPLQYLYEPNAAIMKSGAFKSIGLKYQLHKLHKNTHLYTSDKLAGDFPGRIFEIEKVWQNSGADMKSISKNLTKANIATRNYPLKPEELRKKLKLNDGGDTFLFGCMIGNDEKIIIQCRKIA